MPGLEVEVEAASSEPVSVRVETTNTNLVASMKTFVENYNRYWKRLGELTKYDAATNQGSLLTGNSAALRMNMEVSYLVSGRFGRGSVQSLGELGISHNDDGTLALDESRFRSRLAADPKAVEAFFTAETTGFSARFKTLTNQLAGDRASLVTERVAALDAKIAANQGRVAQLNERLARQKERLLLQFYRMETAIGKMQSVLNVLSQIQPLTVNRRTSST